MKDIKKYLLLIFSLILFNNLSVFSQKIFTSNTALKLIMKEICGTSIAVDEIMKIDSSEKPFKLNPKMILNLSNAKAIIYHSDEIEPWVENIPSSNKINLSDFLDSIPNNNNNDTNKVKSIYFYLNPIMLKSVVPIIADTLAKLDPINAEKYLSNSASFQQKLDLIDILIQKQLLNVKSRRIATLNKDLEAYCKQYNILMLTKSNNANSMKKSLDASNINSLLATRFPLSKNDSTFSDKIERRISKIYLDGRALGKKELRNYNDYILAITNRLQFFMK